MKLKRIIRNVFVWVAWSVVGCSMIVLLVAANRRQDDQVCREVVISINSEGERMFFDREDIAKHIKKIAQKDLSTMTLTRLDLAKLENGLEKSVWIRDAEIYLDSRNVLHVVVNERQPVARVFTTNGDSFYMDSSGRHMPLMDKETARVLLVTNFPAAIRYTAKDSSLHEQVRTMAKFIDAHPFWKEQITQIDVRPDMSFEAVPLIGNHRIRIGNADRIDDKLNRLFLFYMQVMRKTGFDKYAVVDVQYNGQVVGVHRGKVTGFDSVQLHKNIEEILGRRRQQQVYDSLMQVANTIQLSDTALTMAVNPIPTGNPNDPYPLKTNEQPKAVMTKTGGR